MCFTLPWYPPKWVTTGLTIIFLLKWIVLLHKDETLSFCGDLVLTSETVSKSKYLTDPCARRATKQHLVYAKCQWLSLCSRIGLKKRGISGLGTTNRLLQATPLKGHMLCNFSPVRLTNSSEGFQTRTAACLLSLISPNTQGSFRGSKDLNNTCSGKESLRKFAEANLLIFFFLSGLMERAGQAQCNQQSEAKGYIDELGYLTHGEEMYQEIRFHSLLTLLLHWHGSCKNYTCYRRHPLSWKTFSTGMKNNRDMN